MFQKHRPNFLTPDPSGLGAASQAPASGAPHTPVDARRLAVRRAVFATLVLGTIAALTALLVVSFSGDGVSWAEALMVGCFLLTLPWTAIGFWNAVIGLTLMRTRRDPVAQRIERAAMQLCGMQQCQCHHAPLSPARPIARE